MQDNEDSGTTPQRSQVSRRRFLKGMVAFGGTSLLAACGSPPAAQAPTTAPAATAASAATAVSSQPPSTTLAYKGELVVNFHNFQPTAGLTEAEKAAGSVGNKGTEAIIAEWEQMHPGITIKAMPDPVAPEGQDAYVWFAQTRLPSGEGPDVFFMYPEAIHSGKAGDKGLLIKLDDYYNQPNPYISAGQPGAERWVDIYPNDFEGVLTLTRSEGGSYFATPLGTGSGMLYYNKTELAKLGFEVPNPATYAQILAICEKAREAGYEFPILGQLGPSIGWDDYIFQGDILEPVLFKHALDYKPTFIKGVVETEELARAINKGLFTATGPEFKETLRLSKLWVPYFVEEWKQTAFPGPADFLSGKVIMYLSGPWFAQRIIDNPERTFEVGVSPTPLITKESSTFASATPRPFIGGLSESLSVHGATKERGTTEASIDLLQYFTAPQNYKRVIADKFGAISVVKGVDPNLPDDMATALRPMIPTRTPSLAIAGITDAKYSDERKATLQEYFLDQISLDEAADLFQKSLEAWAVRAIAENDVAKNPTGTWDLTKW